MLVACNFDPEDKDRLHGATPQKTVLLIVTILGTSNCANKFWADYCSLFKNNNCNIGNKGNIICTGLY
jgi:hypothetical protein